MLKLCSAGAQIVLGWCSNCVRLVLKLCFSCGPSGARFGRPLDLSLPNFSFFAIIFAVSLCFFVLFSYFFLCFFLCFLFFLCVFLVLFLCFFAVFLCLLVLGLAVGTYRVNEVLRFRVQMGSRFRV